QRALIVARRRVQRIEKEFLAVSAGVGNDAAVLEAKHPPFRMSTSGHLVVKLRHPGANLNAVAMCLAYGVAQCIERLEPWRARRDPTGIEDQSGGNLIVFILFCGEIDRADSVLCRQGYEGCDILRPRTLVTVRTMISVLNASRAEDGCPAMASAAVAASPRLA